MTQSGKKKGYYSSMLHHKELDTYLILLQEIVHITKNRDLDHHEFYDERVPEELIDDSIIDEMESQLARVEPPA